MKGSLGGEQGLGNPTAYYGPPNVGAPRLSLRASVSYPIVKTDEPMTQEGGEELGKQFLMRVVNRLGLSSVVVKRPEIATAYTT